MMHHGEMFVWDVSVDIAVGWSRVSVFVLGLAIGVGCSGSLPNVRFVDSGLPLPFNSCSQ